MNHAARLTRGSSLKTSRLKAVFNAIDADGNGHVDMEELTTMLQKSGIDMPQVGALPSYPRV